MTQKTQIFVFLVVTSVAFGTFARDYGDCSDNIQADWLSDGRKMKISRDYTYIDNNDKKWHVPEGAIVDGASIPRFLWSFIGGPFEGRYREASVPHDVECKFEREKWQLVHKMFHDLMRCSHVSPPMALIMYGAVYHCGPRWGHEQEIRLFPCHGDFGKALVRRLRRFVAMNPEITPYQITKLSDEALYDVSGLGVLEVAEDLPADVDVRETLEGFVITFSRYAPSEVSVSSRASEALERIAPMLRSYSRQVVVAGHTDSVGPADLNMSIGQMRAENVEETLVSYGLDPTIIRTLSFGEERPVETREDPESRAANRRVEIFINELYLNY